MRSRLAAVVAALVLAAIAATPAAAVKPAFQFTVTAQPVTTACNGFSVDATATWSGAKADGVDWALVDDASVVLRAAVTQLRRDTQRGSVTVRLSSSGLAPGSSATVQARLLLNGTAITAWTRSSSVACTGTNGPDLLIAGVTLLTDLGSYAFGYRVTPGNAGGMPAPLASVGVQGYYSTDAVLDPATDAPACGWTWDTGTAAIPGAPSGSVSTGTPLDVYCSAAPGAATHLFVVIDVGGAVTELDETNNTFDLPLGG